MRDLVIQFIKFSFVGLTAFAIDYGLFLILYAAGVPYLIANIISYFISTVYNFLMSMRYVFPGKTGQTRAQQFAIFITLSVIGLGLNELFLWMFVGWFSIPAAIAKIMATFLVMIFNFITRKLFLEDRKPKQEKEIADTLGEGTREVFSIMDDLRKLFGREVKITTEAVASKIGLEQDTQAGDAPQDSGNEQAADKDDDLKK